MKTNKYVFYAVLAAVLYAISTPISKLILDTLSPTFIADLLYLGAGLGMTFVGCGYDGEGADALFGYIFGGITYAGGPLTRQYYNVSDYKNYFVPTTLYSVTVQNASNISYGAFYNCATLGWVYLNEGISYVGENAFKSCSLVTIYSGDLSEPVTWHENWNPDSRPVNWGVV